MGFMVFGSPEDAQHAIDQQQMSRSAARHELASFLESLDRGQLKALRTLLTNIAIGIGSGDPSVVPYLHGLVDGELNKRFDICVGCGENHEEVLAAGGDPLADQRDEPEANADQQQIQSMFDEYNLEPIALPEGQPLTSKTPGKCKNCGQDYISLDDRMLRKPELDGCPGCVNKAKWG